VKTFIFFSFTIATLLIPIESFGFNFTATSTSESCPGNGTISFNSTDTNPNGSIVYFVYKLPEVSIPLSIVSTNSISGLGFGTYKIVAKEYVGTTFVSKEATVEIENNVIALTYSITTLNSLCSNLRDVIINVTTGNPVYYEIFSGPVTFPLQSSNIFTNVPAGVYQIRVFDNCGNGVVTTFTVLIGPNVLNIGSQKKTNIVPTSCDSVIVSHVLTPSVGGSISYPLTLQLTATLPDGSAPLVFNVAIPTGDTNSYTYTQTLPMFINQSYNYLIVVTDNCGQVYKKTFALNSIIKVVGVVNAIDCNDVKVGISTVNFTPPYTITFNSYPDGFDPYVGSPEYPGPYTSGSISFGISPFGNYDVTVEDACGRSATSNFDVESNFENLGLNQVLRPGCELGKGSVKINSKNSKLTSIVITAAPADFPFPLPYNGNANIANDGNFYMNSLPSGDYTISCIDECGFNNTANLAVAGYSITRSDLSLQTNCGSFNIELNFNSNTIAKQKFWLQKLINPNTNTWGNPYTNIAYTDATVPNVTNSYPLVNEATSYNFIINGTFRVVRSFASYNNGNEINSGLVASGDKDCIEILSPILNFNQAIELKDIYRLPCSPTGSYDVIVVATASSLINYKIVSKNGLPFVVDNGNTNIFTNLQAGSYTFTIQDECGNSILRTFDISNLLSLVTAYTANDMFACASNASTEHFDLTTQNASILGSQSPSEYTISYFTSLIDAQNNTNPIANSASFHPTMNVQTVFVRLIFNKLPNCYQTTSFKIIVNVEPKIALSGPYSGCASNPLVLDASLYNLPTTTYLWSTGQTTPKITVSEYGETHLTITVYNKIGDFVCSNTKEIVVYNSAPPVIDHVDVQDFSDSENSVTIYTANTGEFEYSIDGIHYQDDNYFGNLSSDIYTVYVKDKKGCGIVQQVIWVLNYPKFFTPNGDGANDTWYIKNLNREHNYKIYINDRYNNLIKIIDSKSNSWDGRMNGLELVSDDYWFTIERQDGKIYKGHFAMKR
jgi:gliding motility-associated-like protein